MDENRKNRPFSIGEDQKQKMVDYFKALATLARQGTVVRRGDVWEQMSEKLNQHSKEKEAKMSDKHSGKRAASDDSIETKVPKF